jgi:hypothetical protein
MARIRTASAFALCASAYALCASADSKRAVARVASGGGSADFKPAVARVASGGRPLIVAIMVAASAGAMPAARAADCLAGPNAQSPPGRHWYYRIDRASHRKCWYLGELKRHRGAAQTNTRRSVAPPADEPDEDAAPPAPARAAVPEPDAQPEPPPAAVVAPPPVEPARAAGTTPVSEPIGARRVATERVRNEAAPPKPPQPAKPQAAPVRAAAGEARSALPAALFGLALLLAVVGTILVRARHRLIRVQHRYGWRGANESAARPPRSLREILARAEPVPEDARAHATRFFDRIRRGLGESPAPAADDDGVPFAPRATTPPPDIAAATLQPAIDPLVPEQVEPAPDVEQSLRDLLAEWERRAA